MTNLQNKPANTKSESQLASEATAIIYSLGRRLCHKDDPISQGIMNCINDGTPATKIIREITEMANDNYTATANLVGETLLLSITNFYNHV